MMNLGLQGKILVSQTAQFTVGLQFSDDYFIRIESPFTIELADKRFRLSPESPSASFDVMSDLTGRTIVESSVSDSGGLSLIFEGAAHLLVEPDNDYEAWTVSGPDGMLIVCMPGGELAVWNPTSDGPNSN